VYKQRFASALDEDRFEDAEQVVAALRHVPGEEQWCRNAEAQIGFRRRRA
jgi:hypothetical protein